MVLFTLETTLLIFLPCIAIYVICLGVYRLYFSPLAKFPGPRLAALTLWHEFYHDVVRRGQYEFEIAKYHAQYGPIVRINPYELHIADPEFYDTLYPGSSSGGPGRMGGQRVEKWPWVMKQFGTSLSSFGTSGHELHRARRAAVAPFFSKRAVTTLEPSVQQYVDKLVARLEALRGTATPVNLVDAYSCLTGDIITEYCFGQASGFLEDPDFSPMWHKLIVEYGGVGHLCKQFGWILPTMEALPERVAEAMNPGLAQVAALKRLIRKQIDAVDKQRSQEDDMKGSLHRTVFHEILDSDMSPEEKSAVRLENEGNVLVVAGTGTTADTLSITSFHLLRNPELLKRLRQELSAAHQKNGPLKLQHLEQLPFLTAIIKEGLRTAHGVAQRLARIFPDADLRFREWIIPRGTPTSMSSWMVHTDATVFPEPHRFNPDRWLENGQRLEKYLASFGKGTRQCVGLNLAWAELYLTLAAVFAPGRFDIELYETDESDVQMARDNLIPATKDDSKGVRVLIE